MSIGYTKEDLKEQLRKMGFSGNDAVMVHSSMKALGNVEGGADTVVDAFIEFFSEGMFMTPTHTWKQMSEEYAVFDPKNEPACVGIIPNVFMKIAKANMEKINHNASDVHRLIASEKVTVKSKIREILKGILTKGEVIFNKTFCIKDKSKIEVITAFMAMLELNRACKVSIDQEYTFGDIKLTRK